MSKSNKQRNIMIGQMLQEIRINRNFTQAQIAEVTHLNQNQVSLIECGKSKASVEVLLEYCEALRVTPSMILHYPETECTRCIKMEMIRQIIDTNISR